MAIGTMGLRGWRPAGWSGFIAGVVLGAVLVSVAWGAAVVAGSRTGEVVAASTADPTGAYVAAMAEHERLIGETLALELAAERGRPRLTVVAPVGLAPVESYAAEHGRLVGATLGGEFTAVRLSVVAPRGLPPVESYVEQHQRLMAPQIQHVALVATPPTPDQAAAAGGDTYVDEHERLLRGSGAFFPEGE